MKGEWASGREKKQDGSGKWTEGKNKSMRKEVGITLERRKWEEQLNVVRRITTGREKEGQSEMSEDTNEWRANRWKMRKADKKWEGGGWTYINKCITEGKKNEKGIEG